jgi:hypothetical protein
MYRHKLQERYELPVGAMEPTARPMEEAVKDSKHVMPMNLTNLCHNVSMM